MSTRLDLTVERTTSHIVVGSGLLAELEAELRALDLDGRVALVADERLRSNLGEPLLERLRSAGREPLAVWLPSEEATKQLTVVERVVEALARGHIDRGDLLVTLGGGVIGDLGGFVASVYLRGLRWVQLPTTLLAQVDSSIGGKVAVDHPLGKNLIGAYHPPRLILSDVGPLGTLPARERWNGLAELVKIALVADDELATDLERDLDEVGEGQCTTARLEELVVRGARLKVDLVAQDARDAGPRLLLNFGHTFGHALEAATGYGALRHGEAVVYGLRAAVRISQRLGRCSEPIARRALELLARFPAPPPFARPQPEALLAALRQDKKIVHGKLRFVLMTGWGAGALEIEPPSALLEEVAAGMFERS